MTQLQTFVSNLYEAIIWPLILLLFALALVFFASGVVNLLFKADDPKARATGRSHLLWGVAGIFIMMSVWSILAVVTATFCGTAFCR